MFNRLLPSESSDSSLTQSSNPSSFEMVSTATNPSTLDFTENPFPTNYILRAQSSRLHDDNAPLTCNQVDALLQRDVDDRIMEVGDGIAADLFPDDIFGFPINDQFVKNFCGSFISTGKLFDSSNFKSELLTATFLNRMVTTIAQFLHSTKKTSLKPLRYFTSIHSDKALPGPARVKPDILIVPLINGCIRQGSGLNWRDAQSLIEITQEARPPTRMSNTIRNKTYMIFCHQPERDFVPSVCITKNNFHIVVTDHSGQIETDAIPFSRTASTLVFFRLVMGLAFLPGANLGLDPTIFRQDQGMSSAQTMSDAYPPFDSNILKPDIKLFLPDSSAAPPIVSTAPSIVSTAPPIVSTAPHTVSTAPPTVSTAPPTVSNPNPDFFNEGDNGIVSISINGKTYPVVRLLFQAQTLIGRATKAFLVKLPDGKLGVLKDSWISSGRAIEADFLKDLNIPFGPQLLDHCVLGSTSTFRDNPIAMCPKLGLREKRCILTYPAGVHISDFSCLWELMVALLDAVVCMNILYSSFNHLSDFFVFLGILYLESCQKVHRDISYTNILLREPGLDSESKLKVRENFMASLGLSDISELRRDLKCREGLLIDFDYGASLSNPEDSGAEIGARKTTEGDTNDKMVLEDKKHPPRTFPHQVPSGSRTVCFSLFQDCSLDTY